MNSSSSTRSAEDVREAVREGYAQIAKSGGSCCGPTPTCCGSAPAASENLAQHIGYSAEELAALPEGANMGLSCGNPNALAALRAGEVVLVAPEATRSPALREAKEGIAYLAYKSGAPIVPVAVEGTEGVIKLGIKRPSDPGAVVRLGVPFCFKPMTGRPSHAALRQMTDEAM